MTGPVERPRWRGGSWALMLASFGLAVAAVTALALGAEDTRMLRLGIIAALWAGLLVTFAAARIRREISSSVDRMEELRTVYQLELQREIAARREHELTVERELREQLEQRQQAEIVALRAELQSLQGTLQHLLGQQVLGRDVLVERVALRESTRLRPLPDPPRPVPAPEVGAGRAPRIRDPGFAERSWSPAVNWAPSVVDSTVPSAGTGPGRRRRAEPRPSLPGTQPAGWEPLGSLDRTISPEPESDANGSRAAAQSVGAHRGGRSVQELLAAYGESPTPRHRRHRRHDTS